MAEAGIYGGTIRTLQERRSQLRSEVEAIDLEISALDKAITILNAMGHDQVKNQSSVEIAPTGNPPPLAGIYSRISIRWACLLILSQTGSLGLTSAAVTELLVKGGRTSKADRFASTVSAVLSNMKIKGEVEQTGNYWRLTQHGLKAFEAIRPGLEQMEGHLMSDGVII